MSPYLSKTFNALNKEAQFTREMLGSGATQIRNANYATKGIYFQAFTSLSTGIERIGKMCLMLDYFIDNGGRFPDAAFMKSDICHNILLIYQKSAAVVDKRSVPLHFQKNLSGSIHQAILSVLSEFARGDRYSNIDLLVGAKRQSDPISAWFNQVDQPIWTTHVNKKKKDKVRARAAIISSVLSPQMMVLHTSEIGEELTDIEQASQQTGMWEAVAPYRQLFVLQIIRYWVELLISLQHQARSQDIPYFSEIFAPFYNDDSYIRTRKTWDSSRI